MNGGESRLRELGDTCSDDPILQSSNPAPEKSRNMHPAMFDQNKACQEDAGV
jgi:hypothetical protein